MNVKPGNLPFGEYVKQKRLEKNLTLKEFCLLLDEDASKWSEIELGIAGPPQDKERLKKIASALGINEESDEWKELVTPPATLSPAGTGSCRVFPNIAITAIIAMLACACGAFSGYYFSKANSPAIYTADIKKIAEDKKSELVRKLQQDKNNPEAPAMLEKEYAEYLQRLDRVLDAYRKADKRALILRKEAVIEGDFTDITEEIRGLTAGVKDGKSRSSAEDGTAQSAAGDGPSRSKIEEVRVDEKKN